MGSRERIRSLHPSDRILEVYTEALTGFSHVYQPENLNTTSHFQGYFLEMTSMGVIAGRTFQGQGRVKEPPVAQDQLEHQPAFTSSQ